LLLNQKILLPYDTKTITLDLAEQRIAGILRPAGTDDDNTAHSELEIIRNALSDPIGTPHLCDLAAGKKKVTLITSDHTRPVPSDRTLPILLEEIRKKNPDAEITIIVATGLHRGMTEQEMRAKFGDEIFENEHIVNHDAFNPKTFRDLGVLPSGSKCEINTIALDTDLLVAEGFIEPHFFAGFSGGRKSILPGIASQDCVNINHAAAAIQHPRAVTGVLEGNPIHEDMDVAAKLTGLAFIFNVLLDEEKNISAAFCGEPNQAHKAGCDLLMSQCGVDPVKSDIVITTNGGYPLDQNLYQCPKGLDAALPCVNEGGVIILAAACRDGLGGENFGRMMLEGSPKELLERILATEAEKTISEQWCVQRFADALQKYHIILVAEGIDKEHAESMNFRYAENMDKALEIADSIVGRSVPVTVIPNGVSVIVRRT
jgi:nickel-dependent lactate racemase